jgi:hypothetical protein
MERRPLDVGAVTLALSLIGVAQIAHAQLVRAVKPTTALMAASIDQEFKIDGRLDEPFWRLIRPAGRFVQEEPHEGEEPSKRTDVRIVFTADAVIIGARLEDEDGLLREVASPVSEGALPDYFRVLIDPHRDHRTAFEFVITVRGEARAKLITKDGASIDSWAIKWDEAMEVDETGWSIEMRIPLSEMHVEKGSENWGVAFQRFSWKRMETDVLQRARPSARVASRPR